VSQDQSKADCDGRHWQASDRRDQDDRHAIFVIDGKVYGGKLTIDQLKAILDPLIKE
jgi:hypothetical protein